MGIPWRDTFARAFARHLWVDRRAPESSRETQPERVLSERVVAERRVLPRRREFASSSEKWARKRLGLVAFWSLPLTIVHLLALRVLEGGSRLHGWWPELSVLLLQGFVAALARSRRGSASATLQRCAALAVGLGWALSWHWYTRASDPLTQLTPVCLLVVLLPLVIPLPLRVIVPVAAAAAAAQPVFVAGLAIWGERTVGRTDLGLAALGGLSATVLAAVAAAITSRSRSDLARDIGGYRLTRRLGSGGAGEVWEGRHRLLARPAAVKLLSPPTMTRAFLVRFEREAQATALLSSEHTVSLYDFGVTQGGMPYYVMERLVGFDLQRLVEEHGPLCPGRVVHLMKQACDSLAEAHALGIAHRDIKPSNLFLVRRGLSRDFLKILDFGMVSAHDVSDEESGLTSLSQEGYLYGTPAYMPAEQAAGLPVDHRADLYQLGCVMYFLLTGRVVFEKKSPLALAVAHATEKPEPPSRVAPGPVAPELDALILRCLEKDPEQRFQTAERLLHALSSLGGEGEWTPEDAAAWWAAHAPPADDERTTILRALRSHAL